MSITKNLKSPQATKAFQSVCLTALAGLIFPLATAPRTFAAETELSSETTASSLPASERVHPALGLGLSTTPFALPASELRGASWGLRLSAEFMPPWIQRYGILSLGTHLTGFFNSTDIIAKSTFSMGAASFTGRYAFRYFSDQVFVPWIGYEASFYRLVTDVRGTTRFFGNRWLHGPAVGCQILLNHFAPAQAEGFYYSFGFARTYLTAEVQVLNESELALPTPQLRDASIFFGFRIER